MKKTQKPILILLSGGSGSGKTTVASEIMKNLPSEVSGIIVCQDSYYTDQTYNSKFDPAIHNFDHPNAFDWKLMKNHIKKLLNKNSVKIPIYNYSTHSRELNANLTKPADIIIFEGIHALYDDELNSLAELKIFVDTPKDESFIRRLERDVQQRGRDLNSVITQWRETVKPMYEAFIEPLKLKADVIIPWNNYQSKAVDIIRKGLINLQKNN